ncbi:hypothetical protein F5X68DRAFT_233216 [Plectosphaerella plurivora]|uniref:Uncharacterized protein n=1 Tax=Plectosphaerella plurivora TaxID=936078 RepID=A0A9P8V947_9PEZI|nr:hypothetical protein F5X68DRAFT_233216 [Plectosphaerella plurivora]
MKAQTLALGLLPVAQAFEVVFYLGQACRGQRLAWENVNFRDNAFECHDIPVNAVSATIVPEDGDQADQHVAFFTGSDCNLDNARGSHSRGCITFSVGGETGTHFGVWDNDSHPGGRLIADREETSSKLQSKGIPRPRDAVKPWQIAKDDARKQLGLADDKGTGSLSPTWEPSEEDYQHGMETEEFGSRVKLQQLAPGVFREIPVEEWDDNVHTKGEEFVAYGVDELGDYDSRLQAVKRGECDSDDQCPSPSLMAMPQPTWNHGLCRYLMECGRHIPGSTYVHLASPAWEMTVRCANSLVPYGHTLYDWISGNSVLCKLGDWTGGAITSDIWGRIVGSGGATAASNDEIKTCTSGNSQVDALIEAIRLAANRGEEGASTVTVTLPNGYSISYSGMVFKTGTRPENPLCGVQPNHLLLAA